MKNESFEQELNKRYGAMSVKEFTDKMRELSTWLDGYLSMIYPSLDEEVSRATFAMILVADIGYSMGVRGKLSDLAAKEVERTEREMSTERQAESKVDDMLKNLGIRKENANPDTPLT